MDERRPSAFETFVGCTFVEVVGVFCKLEFVDFSLWLAYSEYQAVEDASNHCCCRKKHMNLLKYHAGKTLLVVATSILLENKPNYYCLSNHSPMLEVLHGLMQTM
jgi:hypothetical protein